MNSPSFSSYSHSPNLTAAYETKHTHTQIIMCFFSEKQVTPLLFFGYTTKKISERSEATKLQRSQITYFYREREEFTWWEVKEREVKKAGVWLCVCVNEWIKWNENIRGKENIDAESIDHKHLLLDFCAFLLILLVD